MTSPADLDAECRAEYECTYHKVKAEVGYDLWEKIWHKAYLAGLEAAAKLAEEEFAECGFQRHECEYHVRAIRALKDRVHG